MVVDRGLAYFTEQNTGFRRSSLRGRQIVSSDKSTPSAANDFSSTISKIKAASPQPDVINAR